MSNCEVSAEHLIREIRVVEVLFKGMTRSWIGPKTRTQTILENTKKKTDFNAQQESRSHIYYQNWGYNHLETPKETNLETFLIREKTNQGCLGIFFPLAWKCMFTYYSIRHVHLAYVTVVTMTRHGEVGLQDAEVLEMEIFVSNLIVYSGNLYLE